MFAARLAPHLAMLAPESTTSSASTSHPMSAPTSTSTSHPLSQPRSARLRARSVLQTLSRASVTAVFFTLIAKTGHLLFLDEPILAEFFHAVFLLGLAAQILAAWCAIGYSLLRRQTHMLRFVLHLAALLTWDQVAGPAVLVSATRMHSRLTAHASGMVHARPGLTPPAETRGRWEVEHGDDIQHLLGARRLHYVQPGSLLPIVSLAAVVLYAGYRMVDKAYPSSSDDLDNADSFSEASSIEDQAGVGDFEKEGED